MINTVNQVIGHVMMYGYVYITENLVNGRKYIGKHRASNLNDDGYLGSGTAIKHAIKKYGATNFTRQIISIAGSKDELDVLEIAIIAEYDAVNNLLFYNIRSGGGSNYVYTVDQLTKYAAKTRLRWEQMTPDQRFRITECLRQSLVGRPKKPEHRAKISAAKLGISNWTPESLERMKETRRRQIAMGIGVPPKGNRGNKNYRHSEKGKAAIRAGIAEAHKRIFSERDTYYTEEGRIAMLEKFARYYTPEVRQDHIKRIRDGQARRLAEYKALDIDPPTFLWYHNPVDLSQRGRFTNNIPDGWIAGRGKTGPRSIDHVHVIQLIHAGRKDADIARAVGCTPSSVWKIRHDLESK